MNTFLTPLLALGPLLFTSWLDLVDERSTRVTQGLTLPVASLTLLAHGLLLSRFNPHS